MIGSNSVTSRVTRTDPRFASGQYGQNHAEQRIDPTSESGNSTDKRGAAPGTALVALSRQSTPERFARARPSSAFLAQLLAHRHDLPQTREKRRAAPEDVSARYEAQAYKVPPYALRLDQQS